MPDSTDGIMIPLCAVFRRFLKKQGLKFTPERALVLDAVLAQKGVFEADAVDGYLRSKGHRLGKATIYRTLKHLLDAGIIGEVLIGAKQSHYRLTFGQPARGHLVCIETGRIVEFAAPELESLRDRICAEHGFDPVSVRLVIHGVSPEARESDE